MKSRLFRITILVLLLAGLWGTARVQDRFEVVDSNIRGLIRDMNADRCRVTSLSARVRNLHIPTELKVADILYDGIVVIKARGRLQGSGFAISKYEIMTAAHVVKGYSNLYIERPCGDLFHVVSVSLHPDLDVAILQIKEDVLTPLKINSSGDFLAGDEIFAIGSPIAPEYTNILTVGIVAGINRVSTVRKTQWATIFIANVVMWHGSSGCAVFNKDNEVIGLCVGGNIPGLTVCIPIGAVLDWIICGG